MKSFRPYAIAIALFLVWLTCQSCQSTQQVAKSKTQKYYDKVIQHRQYAIVNNQIIIFKNNY
jgi:hypothetical protein